MKALAVIISANYSSTTECRQNDGKTGVVLRARYSLIVTSNICNNTLIVVLVLGETCYLVMYNYFKLTMLDLARG